MKKALILLIALSLSFLLAGCGSNPHDGSSNGESGSIAFQLSWDTSSAITKEIMALPLRADVCDYQIDTINATVANASGQTVATGSWSCSAHSGTIPNVPVGTMGVTVEGVVGGVVVWRGQATGITVTAGQIANAGTIAMVYIGGDHIPPMVQSVNPLNGATGVSLSTTVSAIFSEPVVTASVNTSTFALTCGTTNVTGAVTYDSATRTATFTPGAPLPAASNCTATITTGVEDLAGQPMAANYQWGFTRFDLGAPTGVTATAGNQQNSIAWLPVIGATSYNIYWSTASGVNKSNGTKISDVASPYTHSSPSLTNWITYYYVVTAVNALGESFESQEVSAVPRGPSGSLDTTFNSQGWVVHNNAAGGNGYDIGRAIAIDSNGRILVTGQSVNSSGNDDMVIWRYNPNGALDTTFNGQGYVVHHNAAGGNSLDMGYGIALDSSGRILVAGGSWSGGGPRMVIWRYNTNGTLDTTFNGQGFVVQSTPGHAYESGNGITIDSSGRILVTGYMYNNTLGNNDMAIWRFNSNGTLDTTFNGLGYFFQNGAAGGNYHDNGSAITLDSSGRILVAGYSSNGTHYDMVIWRFSTTGTLDTSFNGQGFVVYDIPAGAAYGNSITLDSSGRILVTGHNFNTAGDADMDIWRYNSNGTLNASFFYNGTTGGANESGNGITIDSSGRILVAGGTSAVGNGDMAIWRYNSNGTLDTTFNGQGWVFHNSAAGGNNVDSGTAIKIDSLGRILVTGSSRNAAGNDDMVIWRYNP